MRRYLIAFTNFVFFNLFSLSLVVALIVYRAEFTYAQGDSERTEFAVLNPRDTQTENDDHDDDDDGDDPPMDNDDSEGGQTYTVQPGDTLWGIAKRLGVSYNALKAQTTDPSLIHPGEQFTYANENRIDTPPPTDSPEDYTEDSGAGQTFEFTVRPGDILSQIAEYLGVPLESLAAQTDNPSAIYPGQVFYYVSEYRIDTPPLFTDLDGTDSDGHDTPPETTDYDGYVTPPPPPTDYDGTESEWYATRMPDLEYGYRTPPPPTDNDGIDTLPDLEYGYTTQPPPTDHDGIDTLPDLEYGYDGHFTPASQSDFGRWS